MSEVEQSKSIEQFVASAGGSAATDAAAAPAAANPLHLVQDRLQNRWKWVLICSAIIGPLLAVVAYKVAPVRWASVGYVQLVSELKPLVDQTMDTERITDFGGFIATRATLMRSDRVLESVVRSVRTGKPAASASTLAGRDPVSDIEIVRGVLGSAGDDAEAVGFLRAGLSASVPRGSNFIEVKFESPNPALPAAVVNLVLDSFMTIYGPDAETEHTEQMAKIRSLATQVRMRLEKFGEDRMAAIKDSEFYSPDMQSLIEARQQKIQMLDARVESVIAQQKKIERQYRERAIARGEDPGAVPPEAMFEPTLYELERIDPRLVSIRQQIEDQAVLLALAREKYLPEHPALQRIAVELSTKESLLRAAREGAMRSWREGVGSTQSYGALEREKSEIAAEKRLVGEGIERANQVAVRIAKIDRDIESEEAELSRLGERLRELDREAESIRRGRVTIVEGASRRGAPESDKRVQLAIVGLAGGCVASFAIFFLLGSVDPRAYRVHQLQRDGKSGPWLGVVPDMTSAAIDPATKELASNCVHRIRNKIEARRQDVGGGYAIMVTSPFQGDGKTTVAVALAWSYAESGHRTVLVDCDFIGRALSHQFQHLHSPGVCDVLRRGGFSNEVVEVGRNLSLLPVGADLTFSASNLQIGSLRRLFRTLRDQFDIIIVDSGPVTASVEAIPVASSCDGAVMAIRRGRSRARLPESVRELTDAGIDYLGLVLNYADADDCRRYGSISKMSVEVTRALAGSTASATPHPLLGPGRQKGS